MNAIVHTSYSIYEVDTENKRVRRLMGFNPPTSALGDDNVWREYTVINFFGDSLFIEWADLNPESGNPRGTRTSPIVKIEGDLDIPQMIEMNLP